MKNIFVVLVAAFLLSGCLAGTSLDDKFMGDIQTAFEPVPRDFDPREAAAETGADVDISALPNTIGTATASDELVAHDQSAAEGSRIVGIHFSAAADEWLNGVGGFTTPTAAQVDAVSAASGGTFKGDIDIGDADTSTETRSLEIGKGRTDSGYSFIDLVADTTYTDYGSRWLRNNSGANSDTFIYHRGTGGFYLQATEAASIFFLTDSTTRGYFSGTGLFTLSAGTGINEFSTDGTLAGDSDDAVPTEKAVKTYVDAATGALPSGTINQILQHNGTAWVASSTLTGLGSIDFDDPSDYKLDGAAWMDDTSTDAEHLFSASKILALTWTASDITDFDTEVANNSAVTANTAKTIDNTAYNATTWDANTDAATKDAIRDKFESLSAGHDAVTIGTANGLSLSTQELSMSAAGISTTGTVQLASTNEINTGTETSDVITPDAFAASNAGSKEAAWHIYDSDTDTATGDGKQAFVVPSSFWGMNLVDVTCSVADLNSATGGATTVVVRRVRSATAVDMTSTGVTVAYNEYTASDETVNTSNDDIQKGDKIYVDVDGVTTGAVQKGLGCTAIFRIP